MVSEFLCPFPQIRSSRWTHLIDHTCALADRVGVSGEKRECPCPSPLTSWCSVLSSCIHFHCCVTLSTDLVSNNTNLLPYSFCRPEFRHSLSWAFCSRSHQAVMEGLAGLHFTERLNWTRVCFQAPSDEGGIFYLQPYV